MITIRVPASTSNLGAGFDTFGLALELYLDVAVEPCDDPALDGAILAVEGEGAGEIPSTPDNLVNVAYRLVASMRFNPSSKRYRLRAGTASSSGGTLGLLVRNAGNTADAVGGSVRITGGGGARNGAATAVRILPGKLVRVKLASTRGLRRGTYSARITLTQGGKTRLTTTKRFTVG